MAPIEEPPASNPIPREEEVLKTHLLYLDAFISATVAGLVAGLALFLATIWLVLKGGPVVGPHLALLSEFFIGYQVSWGGSLIGFGYAFATAFLLTYFVVRVYNWLAALRSKT